MKEKLTIVKVGGKIVEESASLGRLVSCFGRMDGLRLLVHGGGRTATETAARLGIATQMIDGRRVTDAPMLEVVTMVYGGLVNKRVVALLEAEGLCALGLTGADMGLIRSRRRPVRAGVDYGFVGDVGAVDANRLASLLQTGVTPVVAPLTLGEGGQLLNTNADTMASALACALAPLFDVTLVYCFEHAGVLRDPSDAQSVIPTITPESFAALRRDGIVSGGMIPKIENALAAVGRGVGRVVITSAARPDGNSGTSIVADLQGEKLSLS